MSKPPAILPTFPPPPPHWIDSASLSPPPIPSGKYLYVLGNPIHKTHQDKLAQDEEDIKQKTHKDSIETRTASLKHLNRTLLMKFLHLTQTLVQSPSEYNDKINEIKSLMMNMQHLLNMHRPHEARETIITILENQLKRRKQVLEVLKERINAADEKLKTARERLDKQLSKIDLDEEFPPVDQLKHKSSIETNHFSASNSSLSGQTSTNEISSEDLSSHLSRDFLSILDRVIEESDSKTESK